MAVLQSIRNRGILLTVVIGASLLLFIITSVDTSGSFSLFGNATTVVNVGGEKVDVNEYMGRLDQLTEVYKIEMGQNSFDDETHDQIRVSVYENYLREILTEKECAGIGMQVSKKELYNLIVGNNISPLIQGRRAFYNPQTGMFDPQILAQFIKTLDATDSAIPAEQLHQMKAYWSFWERMVKGSRLEEKYTKLLTKMIVVNSLEAQDNFAGVEYNVDFVSVSKPYTSIADSLVKVSNSDLKKVYERKKETFVQTEDQCNIKYLSFDIVPSSDDYAKASVWINGIKDEFSGAADVAAVTNKYSETVYNGSDLSKSKVDADLVDFAFNGKAGEVFGPQLFGTTFKMAKLVETGISYPDSVKVSMIVLAGKEMAALQTLSDSIKNAVKGGANFTTLATKYSADPQAVDNGGDLGWVTEDAVSRDLAGKLFKTAVKGVFEERGFDNIRLFQIAERGPNVPRVKLAVVTKNVIPSAITRSTLYETASKVSTDAKDVESLDKVAADLGLVARPAFNINRNASRVSNLTNARDIVRWAFDAKENTVSHVFELGNTLVVAALVQKNEKGYRPFESVKDQLKAEATKDKKAETIAKELNGKTIAQLAASGLRVDTVRNVNFSSNYASIGYEPQVFAAVSGLELNKSSKAIVGNAGVYVVEAINKTASDVTYNEKETIESMTNSSSYMIPFAAIEALKKANNIEDNRYKFF